ncbi:MAG: hypothetical protein IIC74_07975 [Bacteroidetes bacterium]|nr:hypothetical protein [Bacteroidota bacterium]
MAGNTFPRFRLYQSDGTTLVYEFSLVLDWDNSPFQDPITFSLHKSLRGQGGIVSEGSQDSFDFPLNFMLTGTDYKDVVAQMNTLPTTILNNTKYVLRIDLDEVGTTKDLKVLRLSSILFPVTTRKKVVNFQEGIITFVVNVWA